MLSNQWQISAAERVRQINTCLLFFLHDAACQQFCGVWAHGLFKPILQIHDVCNLQMPCNITHADSLQGFSGSKPTRHTATHELNQGEPCRVSLWALPSGSLQKLWERMWLWCPRNGPRHQNYIKPVTIWWYLHLYKALKWIKGQLFMQNVPFYRIILSHRQMCSLLLAADT